MIKPGDLFTYKPAYQYKNTVRFLLFTTPDRSMYAFFDPNDNTVHLIDYIKVDISDVEIVMKTKSGDLCLMHMSSPDIDAIFFIAYKSLTEIFVIAHMHHTSPISMWFQSTESFEIYEKYLKKL